METTTKTAKVEKAAAEPKAEKPAKVAPVIKDCLCGCGVKPTRHTSNFVQGHDARLKGRIIKAAQALAKEDRKPTDAHLESNGITEPQLVYMHANWPDLLEKATTSAAGKQKERAEAKAKAKEAVAAKQAEAKAKKEADAKAAKEAKAATAAK